MVVNVVKFKELGFKTFEDYKKFFFSTLMPTNKTYEYFVNWDKVRKDIKKYLEEISLLNALTKIKSEERINYLKSLLTKYPRVVEVLPMLIAERAKEGKIDIFDPKIEEFLSVEFVSSKVNKENIPKILKFCAKTGIIDLFNEVKDIHDYILGIEVGLDSNARKNRSGKIFERMCQQKIRKILKNKGYKIIDNDPRFSLYPNGTKTHDVVIYKDNKPILVGECNFYNTTGSKPISIAESYIKMYETAKDKGIMFLWVTDGPAWKEMKQNLMFSMQKIDWILNYRMLKFLPIILKYLTHI